MKKIRNVLFILLLLAIGWKFVPSLLYRSASDKNDTLTDIATTRSFDIEIQAVGELEAAKSTSISSQVRGDLGKIIYLIADGTNVETGDVLVKMDPTPFEEHVEELSHNLKEQQSKIEAMYYLLEWEKYQASHEEKAIDIEIEIAQLEIKKLIEGDGPIEMSRLKGAMQKARSKYEEVKSYAEELQELEDKEMLAEIERQQAQKKLIEEEEAYQTSKMEYESYLHHSYPMQVKKAEMSLKRYKNKLEEVVKSGAFKVATAEAQLEQGKQEAHDIQERLKNARLQLSLTELKAPTPGMVVLREDFWHGQRRKPRVGDVALKNQVILDLPDLQSMVVKSKVREIDLFKIGTHTPATIQVDAYPDLNFKGKILSIGVLALSDLMRNGEEKYFDVVVGLGTSDLRLRPGMTSRVAVHAKHVDQKITVPIQAVFEHHKQNCCYVKYGSHFIAKPIEIGLSNENFTEVHTGLNEGDKISLSMPPQEIIYE